MYKIETKKIINKPVDKVWDMLTDFDSYPNWNKFIREIKGTAKVNSKIETKIKNGEKEMTFKPKVLVFDKNSEFRWKGKLFISGLFDGEHYFLLNRLSDDKTELTHGEIFTGILSKIIFNSIKKETREGFEKMNEGLAVELAH